MSASKTGEKGASEEATLRDRAKSGSAARAKLARRKSDAAKPKRKRRAGELSVFQKAVIVFIVVVFALSTVAGAIASVVQSQNSSSSVELTVDGMDQQFEGTVSDLEASLSDDPQNTDTLESLVQNYLTWGMYVSYLATTDDETSHANDLLSKAVEHADAYLAIQESAEVREARALAQYYEGDTDAATASLEELTTIDADYASGWANLGMVYESQSRTDDALAAYQKAAELDPDDENGVKSYAEGRISSLDGTDAGEGDGASGATDDGSSDDGSSDGATTDGTDSATTDSTTTDAATADGE